MIWDIYPSALDCGISADEFWRLSVLEIADRMDSQKRIFQSELRRDIYLKHFLAQDIGQYAAVAIHGSDNVTVKELWDFFPELFQDEKKEYVQRQLQIYKAQMLDYAYRHNHTRGG